jgi:heptosyltransferase-2
LQQRFPSAEVEILGYPRIAQLAVDCSYACRVRPIESMGLASFFAREGELARAAQTLFQGFDLILSYIYDPDKIFEANVRRCFSGAFISGPHRPDDASDVHATEWFLQPLRDIGIADADPVPRLKVPELETRQNTIAIHPGSGSEKKNWPESRWGELILGLLNHTDAKFLLIGGEAEGDRLVRLAHLLPRDQCQILQNRPLMEVAGHLRNCRLFLGHDSGVSHLAAAAGTRGVVLWGATNKNLWRPRSDQIRLIEAACGLGDLEVQTVLQAVLEELRGASAPFSKS